jgi:ankyrin repeat protein
MRRFLAQLVTVSLALMLAFFAACIDSVQSGFGPLAKSAREGDLTTLQRMLAAGADPNDVDPGGNHWTPLFHAIHKGQAGAVDLLLKAGADPITSRGGVTPLLMAVGTGNAAIVRRLLRAGADPHTDDRVLLTAVSGGALSDLDNPLLGRCNADVVQVLYEKAPDLRLEPGPRTRVALWFAWFNRCGDQLRAAGVKGAS